MLAGFACLRSNWVYGRAEDTAGGTCQITDGARASGDAGSSAEATPLCPSIQPQDLHPASTLCGSRSEGLFQDRLSWHYRDPARFRCRAHLSGTQTHSALYHSSEGESTPAPRTSRPPPVPGHRTQLPWTPATSAARRLGLYRLGLRATQPLLCAPPTRRKTRPASPRLQPIRQIPSVFRLSQPSAVGRPRRPWTASGRGPVCATLADHFASRAATERLGRRRLRFRGEPLLRARSLSGSLLHASHTRSTDNQAADGLLSTTNETTPEQELRPLRPTLASRNRILDAQTPRRRQRAR